MSSGRLAWLTMGLETVALDLPAQWTMSCLVVYASNDLLSVTHITGIVVLSPRAWGLDNLQLLEGILLSTASHDVGIYLEDFWEYKFSRVSQET